MTTKATAMAKAGGIGHAGQPVRLQAHCRSRARRLRLEFPAHPPVHLAAGRRLGFDRRRAVLVETPVSSIPDVDSTPQTRAKRPTATRKEGWPLAFLVEAGGIRHAGQTVRLQAHCRSRARRMRLEFPAHPPSVPDAASIPQLNQKVQRPPKRRVAFALFGGGGGNRTPVREHSTDSSTCVVHEFGSHLLLSPWTGRQQTSNLGFKRCSSCPSNADSG